MAIEDARQVLDAAEATTNFVSDTGGAFPGGTNTDTFIKGTLSIGERLSAASLGFMVDLGAATDVSNETFFFWWNVSTAGLLATLGNGGVRMRFAGATISDFFEVYLAGSDTYSGGWTMSVVSIERARELALSSPTNNNAAVGGTAPATSAIQYVGIYFDMAGMVSGNVDNCFVDHSWRLAADTPGIIVRGDNGGSPYAWTDLVDAADPGDPTKAWGTSFDRDGVNFINCPHQFGAKDSPLASPDTIATDFEDTNAVVFWEDQIVDAGFYNLTVEEDQTNGTSFLMNGGVIGAPAAGADQTRWDFTVPATVTACDLQGVTLLHGGTLDFAAAGVDIQSCVLSDIARIIQGDAGGNASNYDGNSHTLQATLSGEALVETDLLDGITNCEFTFQAGDEGHAIMVNDGPDSQISAGNKFNGYGDITPVTTAGNPDVGTGSFDAALFHNREDGPSPALTVSVTSGGDSPSVRNSASPGSTTIIENNLSITIVGLVEGTEVTVCLTGTETLVAEIEDVASPTDFTFAIGNGVAVDIVIHNIQYEHIRIENIAFTADTTLPVTQRFDRNYSNP